jgi:hypothetical protein
MSGCNLKNVLPFGIANEPTIEEYLLQAAPDPEPFSFVPMQSTQEEILAKHKQERENIYPDNSFFDIYQHGMSV